MWKSLIENYLKLNCVILDIIVSIITKKTHVQYYYTYYYNAKRAHQNIHKYLSGLSLSLFRLHIWSHYGDVQLHVCYLRCIPRCIPRDATRSVRYKRGLSDFRFAAIHSGVGHVGCLLPRCGNNTSPPFAEWDYERKCERETDARVSLKRAVSPVSSIVIKTGYCIYV